ncbi:MAG: hypothetical protein GXP55_08460 [Deltaproteobacteria bacterium]|nr:hypothetical protein [Deltaproteobacteria bacterium]
MTEIFRATRGFLLIGLFSVAMEFFVPAAFAQTDELREFETARQAYTDADYQRAVQLFEALVGGPVPSIQNPALVLESRKYLGAAYLFVGQPSAADQQFEAILSADSDYLIPASFPEAVQEAFESARRRRVAHALSAAEESARLERERREAEMRHLVGQQERMRRLEQLASIEVVERENSRTLALLPFGVGQFQNEDARLGRFFAYTEGALALVSLGTAIGHAVVRARANRLDPLSLRRSARALRWANWASTGALAVMAVAGVIQAQVRFHPRIRHERRRELPDDLRLGPDAQDSEASETSYADPALELVLAVTPVSLDLTLHF